MGSAIYSILIDVFSNLKRERKKPKAIAKNFQKGLLLIEFIFMPTTSTEIIRASYSMKIVYASGSF